MWSAILSILPTLMGWVNAIIDWFRAKKKAQDDQDSAVDQAQKEHQNDGAQSVADKESADAQNAALDQLQKELENPTPVVVTKPGGQ